MPSALKRKGSPSLEEDAESSKRRFAESEAAPQDETATEEPTTETNDDQEPEAQSARLASESTPEAPAPNDRAARFAALRARNKSSRAENLKETRNETRRAAVDPSQLNAIQRKKDVAQHKLLKADTEASGDDFERKRAWDWTVEESARWDERLEEKKRKKDASGFADYNQEAGKVYERQVGMMTKKGGKDGDSGWDERKEAYERSKREALDAAVRSGGLEIVETETGELIAVDKDGSFFSTGSHPSDGSNKPSKASVDRLVQDIKKAEEVRLKKRRERGIKDADDGGDVTFINEKNKQFNQKLARFYDKYTADIRESFERGTAI